MGAVFGSGAIGIRSEVLLRLPSFLHWKAQAVVAGLLQGKPFDVFL